MKNKNRFEVIIYGRGGQGVKSMAELLALAAAEEGKYVQAFPEFGPERSGAPIKAYFRMATDPIRTREAIVDPDVAIVMDEDLLKSVDVFAGIEGHDQMIINSKKNKHQLWNELGRKANFIVVDAQNLSLKIIGENRPNVVMLGRFIFATEIIKLETLKKVFKEKYSSKISSKKMVQNLLAMEQGYDIH